MKREDTISVEANKVVAKRYVEEAANNGNRAVLDEIGMPTHIPWSGARKAKAPADAAGAATGPGDAGETRTCVG
jgi:hypothetical protein